MTALREREPSSRPFSYIIDGYGNIGHKRHKVLGEKCLTTVSRNPQRGADFARSVDIPKNIIDQCDAVIVTTPEPGKINDVAYWLRRGKHVLVEKPFFLKPTAAEDLNRIAQENKVIWHTSYNHRFEPNVERIKKLVESGFLGSFYRARFTYGFGNSQQLKGTWRDAGLGVLGDVGCHLIDLSQFILGYNPEDFVGISLERIEWKNAFDHAVLSSGDRKIIAEVSMLCWKNQFTIELFGSQGSLHMDGLVKWGDSKLSVRTRVLPAGKPFEEEIIEPGGIFDPTWEKDICYFEKMARLGKSSMEYDVRITQALNSIAEKL